MKPRRKVIDATKQKILREAKILFRKRGFASTTMDSVAKASRMSKSTVYVYFKSKDDIFLHIVLEGLIAVRDAIHGLVDAFTIIESFHHAVCDFLVDVHDRDPIFFHSMAGNGLGDTARFGQSRLVGKIDMVREEIVTAFLDNVARTKYGMVAELEPAERLELGYVLWACIYGIINLGEAQSRYINDRFHKDKRAFMRSGFDQMIPLLIHACDSPSRKCCS